MLHGLPSSAIEMLLRYVSLYVTMWQDCTHRQSKQQFNALLVTNLPNVTHGFQCCLQQWHYHAAELSILCQIQIKSLKIKLPRNIYKGARSMTIWIFWSGCTLLTILKPLPSHTHREQHWLEQKCIESSVQSTSSSILFQTFHTALLKRLSILTMPKLCTISPICGALMKTKPYLTL